MCDCGDLVIKMIVIATLIMVKDDSLLLSYVTIIHPDRHTHVFILLSLFWSSRQRVVLAVSLRTEQERLVVTHTMVSANDMLLVQRETNDLILLQPSLVYGCAHSAGSDGAR